MTGSPDKTRDVREQLLSCGCKALADALSDLQIRVATQTPRTHKSHPLGRLIAAAGRLETSDAIVLFNTDRAIRRIRVRDDCRLGTWLDQRIAEGAGNDLVQAGSALGEIRAAGALIEAGGNCLPIKTGAEPTPDFQVDVDGDSFFVEVHTKQMNDNQAKEVNEFIRGERGRKWSYKGITVREQVIHPAGKPKDVGETVGENVASKFASIKPWARQARTNHANLLWIDLQDEDCASYFPEMALPVVIRDSGLSSFGLWHAFYGIKDTPVFDHHGVNPGIRGAVRSLGFPGKFTQTTSWSAVVLSFPHDSIVLEHPNPDARLPAAVWPLILRLPDLQLHLSVMDWPPHGGGIQAELGRTRRALNTIADMVRSGWEVPVKLDRMNWTDDEFRTYSDQALVYELTQLLGARELLTFGVAVSQSGHLGLRAAAAGVLRNAAVESFAIHCRALIWFLYPPLQGSIKESDVASLHYGIAARERPANLQAWYNQANKQVAHTTTERLDLEVERKTWPTEEITVAIVRELVSFINEADPKRLGEGFRGLVEQVARGFPVG